MAKRKRRSGRGLGAPDSVHISELSAQLQEVRNFLRYTSRTHSCDGQITAVAYAAQHYGEALAHADSIEAMGGGRSDDRRAGQLERAGRDVKRARDAVIKRCAR